MRTEIMTKSATGPERNTATPTKGSTLQISENNLDNLAYAVMDAIRAAGIPGVDELDATDLNMALEAFFLRNGYEVKL